MNIFEGLRKPYPIVSKSFASATFKLPLPFFSIRTRFVSIDFIMIIIFITVFWMFLPRNLKYQITSRNKWNVVLHRHKLNRAPIKQFWTKPNEVSQLKIEVIAFQNIFEIFYFL